MKYLLVTIIPIGLMVLFGYSCVFWVRLISQRKKNGRRSPLSGKLLRNPGQSLLPQIEDLTDEISSDIFGILFVPMMLINTVTIQYYFGIFKFSIVNVSLYGFLFFVIFLFFVRRLVGHLTVRNELRLGLEAEMAVGQELNQLMRDGYFVYHDFSAGNFNIDHVAVGPGGVFAVETKGRSKPDKGRGTYDATVVFDGKVLKFPDWEDCKFIEQARRQAEWLKRWVSSAIGENVEVRPVLALPGWYIERKGRSDVFLYNGKNPNSWARAKGRAVLEDNQIKRINHQFEQRCRDIEPVAYRKEKKETSRG